MPLGSLWIPVIVSTIAVFLGSSIIHMALKYHKADYKSLPQEEAVREALRKADAAPGIYFTPYCADMKEMKNPEVMEKYAKGPVALLTVYPKGPVNLPKHLGLWLGFSVVVSFIAAFLASRTLQPDADGLQVMRTTGILAFTAYGFSHVSDSIWKGQPWANTARALLDALIYSLLTGLTFRLLWPAA